MFAYLLKNKTTEYRMLLRLTTIDITLINALFYVVGLNIISQGLSNFGLFKIIEFSTFETVGFSYIYLDKYFNFLGLLFIFIDLKLNTCFLNSKRYAEEKLVRFFRKKKYSHSDKYH